MSKILSRVLAIACTLVVLLSVSLTTLVTPAHAAALTPDIAAGAGIFTGNCSSCHLGGRNVISADKTLKKEALAKYAMNSIEAITTQVTNGKGAMPAFRGRLSAEQINNVAAYVLDKSEKGW